MTSLYIVPALMIVDDSRIDNVINRKVLERERLAANIIIYHSAVEAFQYLSQIRRGRDHG